MVTAEQSELFRKGSRTYYNSSRFFPPEVREDVFVLYAFVRKADNYVDAQPQDLAGFQAFQEQVRRAQAGEAVADDVIAGFQALTVKYDFPSVWLESFLQAMAADTRKHSYGTIGELEDYIYGSAEVIGLFLTRIFGLPVEAEASARALGKAMQYANFIRDLAEDLQLGRTYFPQQELQQLGLPDLQESTVTSAAHELAFIEFMQIQVARYRRWQQEAETGYHYLPWRYLVAVKTAADMYCWTIEQIAADPLRVYRGQLKPRSWRILLTGVGNALSLPFQKRTASKKLVSNTKL